MFRRLRRKIIWEAVAEREVEKWIDEFPRLYDVVKNFEWLLERDPENEFSQELFDEYRMIRSNELYLPESASVPDVLLIYRFDDKSVTFYNMRITPRSRK